MCSKLLVYLVVLFLVFSYAPNVKGETYDFHIESHDSDGFEYSLDAETWTDSSGGIHVRTQDSEGDETGVDVDEYGNIHEWDNSEDNDSYDSDLDIE